MNRVHIQALLEQVHSGQIPDQADAVIAEIQRAAPVYGPGRPNEFKMNSGSQLEYARARIESCRSWLEYALFVDRLARGEAQQPFPPNISCEQFVKRLSEFRYDPTVSALLKLQSCLAGKDFAGLRALVAQHVPHEHPLETIRLVPRYIDGLLTPAFATRVFGVDCQAELRKVINKEFLEPALLSYIQFCTVPTAQLIAVALQQAGGIDRTDKEAWKVYLGRFGIDPSHVFLERNQSTREVRPFGSARAAFVAALKNLDFQLLRDIVKATLPVLFQRQAEMAAANGVIIQPFEDVHMAAALAALIIDSPQYLGEFVAMAEYARVFAVDMYCLPDGLGLLAGPSLPIV